MARETIIPEKLIQQANEQMALLEQVRLMDVNRLKQKPDDQSWSIIETVEHMHLTQQLYMPKFDKALQDLPKANLPWDQVLSRRSSGMFIEGLAPQSSGKIKWKMKTSGIFKPKRYSKEMSQDSIQDIMDDFQQGLNRIKEVIGEARMRDVKKVRFNSALGPIVRFNIAEAAAFMLNHNARHFAQIDRTKAAIGI